NFSGSTINSDLLYTYKASGSSTWTAPATLVSGILAQDGLKITADSNRNLYTVFTKYYASGNNTIFETGLLNNNTKNSELIDSETSINNGSSGYNAFSPSLYIDSSGGYHVVFYRGNFSGSTINSDLLYTYKASDSSTWTAPATLVSGIYGQSGLDMELYSACGNGNIDTGEVCDGTNMSGHTCITEGFDAGTATCANDCKSVVTTNCTKNSSSNLDLAIIDAGVKYFSSTDLDPAGHIYVSNSGYYYYADVKNVGVDYAYQAWDNMSFTFEGQSGWLGSSSDLSYYRSSIMFGNFIVGGIIKQNTVFTVTGPSASQAYSGTYRLKVTVGYKNPNGIAVETNLTNNSFTKYVTIGNSAVPTCNDSDAMNYNNKGSVYGYDSVGNNYNYYDSCSADGTQVIENYCYAGNGGMLTANSTYTCPNGCADGACKGANVTPTCVDTDARDIYNRGSVSGMDASGKSYTTYDECTGSGKQLNEMWCYDLNGGKVAGNMNFDCANGCANGACLAAKSNKTNEAISCYKNLNSYSYLIGFAEGDTLSSIINDDAKLRLLAKQVLAKKAQISGLTGRRLDNNQVPATNEPVIGSCKWFDAPNTANWHIYSYQTGGKVSISPDVDYFNIAEAEARMVKAIKDGYCCCGKAAPAKKYTTEAALIFNSGRNAKGLQALLAALSKKDNTKERTANFTKYVKPLNTKCGPISLVNQYAIGNYITFGAPGTTAKWTVVQRYQSVADFCKLYQDLPSNLLDWTELLNTATLLQVKGVKIIDLWNMVQPMVNNFK
ncbi:MAG: hypothetical protein WCO55_05910, partial [Candidatus Falkowbacteria bacterium]